MFMNRHIELSEARRVLLEGDDYMIYMHRKPDGDTVGSAAALCLWLRRKGKRAYIHPALDMTPLLKPYCEHLYAPADFEAKMHVAVDIASPTLLPLDAEELIPDLVIDHHPSNRLYGRLNHVQSESAACGEVIWELMDGDTDREIRNAVYLAVATDTGCFRFSNTSPRTHRIAAECIEGGCDYCRINDDFFEIKTAARLALEGSIYTGVRLDEGGMIASYVLSKDFTDSLNATQDDMSNLTTLMMCIMGVRIGIMLTETAEGSYKVSVRSRAPIDASVICSTFGGGGHNRAAGCSMRGDAEACRARLVAEAARHL